MVQFAGIIRLQPTESLDHEVKKMLSIMALPKTQVKGHLAQHQNCLLGQTEFPFKATTDQNYLIGLQGSIYNLPQLKEKLLSKGHLIEEDSPEALLILAYQAWGPDFLSSIDGRFVVMIYDKRRKKLFLGRDRIGSHRLYWGRTEGTFLFASRLKGLLASKYVPQRPCIESIASYFYLGYFPQDKTPIVNLNCLLPGYYLWVDHELNINIAKYWNFQNHQKEAPSQTVEEVSARLDQLLIQALEKRNPNKEPFHLYLQGDIGSTALAHYAQKLAPVQTYANEFEGESISSMPYLERVTSSLHLPFEKNSFRPDNLIEDLSEVVWHLDEPIADPNSLLVWDMAKRLSGKTNSIFTSLGCAEFLGLHPGNTALYYQPLFTWFIQLASPAILKYGIPFVSKMSKKSALSLLRFFQKDLWAYEYMKQNCLYDQQLLKMVAPDLYPHFDFGVYVQQTFQYLKYIHSQKFNVTDYFFYDAETTLSNFLIIQYQNLFSAHDIKLFAPYLDMDLFLFLLHTPESLKSRRKRPALPLQHLLKDQLTAQELSYMHTVGPHYLSSWIDNPRLKEIFSLLSQGTLAESGIISQKGIESFVKKIHLYGRPFEKLWAILVLEVWFKLFVNRPVHTYPTSEPLVDYLQIN